jgi:RNA polymerase sigma-70 factor (ECF subfamily)
MVPTYGARSGGPAEVIPSTAPAAFADRMQTKAVPAHGPFFAAELARARAGSREALGHLFELARPYLMQIASAELARQLLAKNSVSDCLQDAFLEAQKDFASFTGRDECEFLGWLRRILLNNLADLRKRFATRTRDLSRELPLSAALASGPLVSNDLSPCDRVAAGEQARAVEEALAALPRNYQTVIRLRHDEDRSFAEIAHLMGKSTEDAARKLWARAVRTLQTTVAPYSPPEA